MKDGPVNIAVPLTPALSPSDGEREKAAAAGGLCWRLCMNQRAAQERPPLPSPLLRGGEGEDGHRPGSWVPMHPHSTAEKRRKRLAVLPARGKTPHRARCEFVLALIAQ
jgi:hypothetical protein